MKEACIQFERVDDALADWFAGYPGRLLREQEAQAMGRVLPDLFGYYLLLVGDSIGTEVLDSSRILHRSVISARRPPDGTGGRTGALAVPEALPLQGDSIDVLILPHVLEFSADAHGVLREADRVLVPEGHLVITGMNPWGLFGLRRAFARRGSTQVPWCGRFIGPQRISDWLSLLGFDIVSTDYFFYRPPLHSQRVLDRLQFMERLGQRWLRYLSGGYMLLARKRVVTLTPIKPRWRPARGLAGAGIAEPTIRQNGGTARL